MAKAEWRRLKDGSRAWYLRWRDPASGEMQSEPLGVIPEEAAKAAAVQAGVDREGRTPKPSDVSPRVARARFLAHLRIEGRRKATVHYYDERLTETMDALSAVAPMPRWGPDHFKAFLRAHPKWSPRRIQMHVGTGRFFLRFAAASRIRVGDFLAGVKGPRVRIAEAPHYTKAEFSRLLATVRGKPIEIPVALGGLAAFAPADIAALDRSEVHLKSGWLRRARSKTGEPIRVPIIPELREVLERRMPRTGRVCVDLALDDSNARRALRSACKQADVPSRGGWYRLRHTCATMLAAAGVDLPTIRIIMGLSPGSTVVLRYLHSDEANAKEGMRTMGAALRKAGG